MRGAGRPGLVLSHLRRVDVESLRGLWRLRTSLTAVQAGREGTVVSGEAVWWVLSIEHRPTGDFQELAVEATDAAEAVKAVAQILGEDWEWAPSGGVVPLNGN